MAQTIKLKRSGTSGNIPTTSQLELGEVAINTYDGKMFIKKNVGGTESIVEISATAADAILVEYQFTSTASQTTYSGSDDNSETLSYTPNAIQVFMNGILLDPGIDFTATNGYSIVLAEAADANDYLQIFAFKKKISDGQVSVDTFTGDDSTVAFTLSVDPGDENNTRVFIDGVYQSKANYSVSGTTLTFSTAPPTDTAVEVEIGNRVVTLDTLSDLDLPDSVRLRLGTGQDLQIYHDGSASYIDDTGAGSLNIRATNLVLRDASNTEAAAFISGGESRINYGGSTKFATTNDGISVTGDIEATGEIIGDVRGAVLFKAQAGESLAKGDVVYISGISGNTTIVSKADADDANKMPAFGLAAAAASSGNPVDIFTYGILNEIDTSSYSEGDELFVSTTAGAPTATKPAGESALLQKIGKVTRSNALSGSIFISGAGRTNAVPNLNEGKLFVGNSSNYAVADDTVHVDIANSRVGVGTTSPEQKLHVDGTVKIGDTLILREDGTNDLVQSTGNVLYLKAPEFNFQDNSGNQQFYTTSSRNFIVQNSLGVGTNSLVSGAQLTLGGGSRIAPVSGNGLNLAAGGSDRMFISTSGNVGIGTSSPSSPLEVAGGSSYPTTKFSRDGGTAGTQGYLTTGFSAIGYSGGTGADSYMVSEHGFGFAVNAGTNALVITDGGNVGIGTISPSEKLTVAGPIGVSATGYTVNPTTANFGLYTSGSVDTTYIQMPTSGQFQVWKPSTGAVLTVLNSGNVGIGTDTPSFTSGGGLQVYNAGQANLRLSSTTNNTDFAQSGADAYIINRVTSGDIKFRVNSSTELLTLDGGTGSVGIAQTSPSSTYKLDVGGAIRSATAAPSFALQETDASNQTWLLGSYGGTFAIRDVTGGTYPVYVEQATPSATLYLDSTGNVGIGTSSPSYPLDILGSHTVYAGNVATSSTATTSYNVIRFTQGAGSGAPTGMIGTGGSATSNSGFAGAFVVGTQTSAPLTLLTNDAERVRIASDGKVAIGGASAFSGTPENTLSLIHDGHGLGFDYVGATLPRTAGLFTSSSGLTQTAWGDLNIKARTDYGNYYGIGFFTAAANNTPINRMVIKANGTVGIGTTAPSGKFHVSSGNQALGFDAGVWVSANPSDYTVGRGAGITMQNADVYTGGIYGIRELNSWHGALTFYTHTSSSGNTFGTTFTEKMRISSDGKVGIGTVTPASKLDVEGEIQSTALTLDAIATTTADTAVDVFVYDTRKDSDGGAWRKRTQHTSWYNETLNTSTRGSRREFPAIAVIVSTLTAVRIFDGDDPDLPLWMEFTAGAQGMSGKYMLQYPNSNGFRTYALNGVLVLGEKTNNDNWGSPIINFISEKVVRADPHSAEGGTWLGNIADRNSGAGYIASNEGYITVNSIVDDVAMKVLPNAPIDETTGLPIPTIALATPGGISVIRHDGSVVDITAGAGASYNGVSWIDFTENNHLIFEQDNSSRAVFCIPIPTSDRTTQTNDGSIQDKVVLKWYATDAHSPYPVYNGTGVVEGVLYEEGDGQALIGSSGELTLLKPDFNSPEQGRVCYIGEDYNTGWMTGDSKLALFSDTDDTNITGSELVTNGTFDSNVSNWTATNSTITLDTNRMKVTRSGGTGVCVYQAITTEVGKTYTVSAQINSVGSRGDLMVMSGLVGSGTQLLYLYGTLSSAVYVSGSFTATTTTTYIYFNVDSDTTYILVDDVSCRVAELDRSMYGQSGQIFNSLVKTPVATGAELVSYNLSSNDGYLAIPSFKGAPGSGDFAISFWIKPVSSNSSYFHIFSLGTASVGGQSANNGFVLKTYGTANGLSPYFYNNDGSTDKGTYDTNVYFPFGKWTHVVAMRRGGTPYIYVNGVLRKTGTSWTTSLTDTFLTIGKGLTHVSELDNDSELALLRYSKTAPTSEEIEKMYTSEKALFATNAKATLYGASTATAVAYDEDTGLLHVGTSAGRSVFQGLRRVENTTDAVGTTISASNGFVAED